MAPDPATTVLFLPVGTWEFSHKGKRERRPQVPWDTWGLGGTGGSRREGPGLCLQLALDAS